MTTTTMSSKGQVVIPETIRRDLNWKEGTKLAVVETLNGIFLVKIPKNPLTTLKGMGKGLNVSWTDIKKMRQEDEEHDRKEYSN